MDSKGRRALLVTYHYPPEPTSGALRIAYLAKYLPEFGWEPIVVTRRAPIEDGATPRGVIRVGRASAMESAAALASRLPAKRVVNIIKDRAREVVFFPDRASWWIPRAVAAGISVHRQRGFDAVVTSAMPASVHVVGWMLASTLHVPWLADYRDLWNGNPYVVEPAWRARLLRGLEKRTLRGAHEITTITQSLAEDLANLHRRKVSVIPNTLDADEWEDIPFEVPDGFRIVYAGSLYNGQRSPERLFAQVAELRESGDVAGRDARFDFYGPEPGNLLELAERYGLADAVSYHGVIDRPSVMRAERAAALLLIVQNDDPRTACEYGSKIYEYQAAGRPVLAVGPQQSVLRGYIEENEIGWFAASDDEIRKAIRDAHQAHVEGRLASLRPQTSQSARSLASAFAAILARATAGHREYGHR